LLCGGFATGFVSGFSLMDLFMAWFYPTPPPPRCPSNRGKPKPRLESALSAVGARLRSDRRTMAIKPTDFVPRIFE
jgi:hypothetical protein